LPSKYVVRRKIQAYLKDTAGLVPQHHNNVNITVESPNFFGFLVHIKLRLYSTIVYHYVYNTAYIYQYCNTIMPIKSTYLDLKNTLLLKNANNNRICWKNEADRLLEVRLP
jgi:hypothetical protein